MTTAELPDSWERVALRELGTWFGGGTPSKSNDSFWTNGTIPWLSPKDMSSDTLADTEDHITTSAVEGSATKLVPADSVAVVVRSGILERKFPVAMIPFATTLNQDMKAIAPHEGIEPKWIAWGLRAYEQTILRECRKAGTTVASIDTARLMAFQIPVPPTAEQRRIVAALDDRLSRLDAAGGLISNMQKRLQAWESSYLLASTVDHPDAVTWAQSTVGKLAKVSTGATPAKSRSDYHDGGTVPWVTSSLLNAPFVDHADHFITEKALAETAVKLFPPGTLLVAMYGEGKTRGKCSQLRISATTNQACAAIQVHAENEELIPWIKLVLDATYDRNRRLAAGGVQPNLNLGMVREITIPLPSDDVNSMIEEVDRQRSLGKALKTQLHQVQGAAGLLRRSLLHTALTGKLVPQDPAEEPTSALLERIRAEQGSAAKPKRVGHLSTRLAPKTTSKIPAGIQEELPL